MHFIRETSTCRWVKESRTTERHISSVCVPHLELHRGAFILKKKQPHLELPVNVQLPFGASVPCTIQHHFIHPKLPYPIVTVKTKLPKLRDIDWPEKQNRCWTMEKDLTHGHTLTHTHTHTPHWPRKQEVFSFKCTLFRSQVFGKVHISKNTVSCCSSYSG